MAIPALWIVVLGVNATAATLAYYMDMTGDDIYKKDFSVNKNPADILEIYQTVSNILAVSVSPEYFDKKVYIYYLYGLVLAQQNFLIKLLDEIKSNEFMEYYKNTLEQWKLTIEELTEALENCLKRYFCYETFIKEIFEIPYNERNIFVIKDKFKTIEELTDDQRQELLTYVVYPLFNGWFDFTAENISVIKCYNTPVIDKVICQSLLIKEFPLPQFIQGEIKKYPDTNEATPDIIVPWILYNQLLLKSALARDLMSGWKSLMDKMLSSFIGVKAKYTVKTDKAAEELKDSAIKFYAETKKDLGNMLESIKQIPQGFSDAGSGFTNTLIWGGLAIGAITLFTILTRNGNEQ